MNKVFHFIYNLCKFSKNIILLINLVHIQVEAKRLKRGKGFRSITGYPSTFNLLYKRNDFT